jgi:deoxycytidylate deaminase
LPCLACIKLVANGGIKTVYYKEFSRNERIKRYAEQGV